MGPEVVLNKGAGAVAIDDANGDVWVYSDRMLHQFTREGAPLRSFPIPAPMRANVPTSLLADGISGSLWLAVDQDLHRFDLNGALRQSLKLEAHVEALALDRMRSILWVAHRASLKTYDLQGHLLFSLPAGTSEAKAEQSCVDSELLNPPAKKAPLACIHGIDFDPGRSEVWVSLSNSIRRYDHTGRLSFEAPGDFPGPVAADGSGGAWIAHGPRLLHVSADGTVRQVATPFEPASRRSIISLAANSNDGSIWVSSERVLKRIAIDGTTLHALMPDFGDRVVRRLRQIVAPSDGTPPELTIVYPTSGLLLRTAPAVRLKYQDVGTGVNPNAIRFEANGTAINAQCSALSSEATCSLTSPLPQGEVLLVAQVSDFGGNLSDPAEVLFSFDSEPPSILVHRSGSTTNEPQLVLAGSLSERATLTIDGIGVPLAHDLSFSYSATLVEGPNSFRLSAVDQAGNKATLALTVWLDTVVPMPADLLRILVQLETDGLATVEGNAGSVEGGALVQLRNLRTGAVVTARAAMDGSFRASIAAAPGDQLEIHVLDAASNRSAPAHVQVMNNTGLPPDPQRVAPPLSLTSITPFHDAIAFLYGGTRPIQIGVAPDTINPVRAAVIRGRTLDRSGAPLPGVTITIKDSPEYGHTLSREDGFFDIAVNGGGSLTVAYSKQGFLPAHRQVAPAWGRFTSSDDVVLIALDPAATVISFPDTESLQVARGSPVDDSNGHRRATLLIPSGTTADLIMADGSASAATQLTIRATEYTVGNTGPKAMPALLPPTTAYTYAVELSADEVLASGAESVRFNKPLLLYIENFIGFPVGMAAPTGFYDPEREAWLPSRNGVVLQILGTNSGSAVLDVDGSGQPAPPEALAQLQITDAELAQLAALYRPGQTLWRVPIPHFSAWDVNWPYGPPPDAENPDQPPPETDDDQDECDEECGSIIRIQNQVLGESISLVGIPATLNYSSDRVPGRRIAATVTTTLTGDQVPASLRSVEATVSIAGRTYAQTFPASPNQTYTVLWDGKDAYGRRLYGGQKAEVRISWIYGAVYYTPSDRKEAFATFGYKNEALDVSRDGSEARLTQKFVVDVVLPDARMHGLGGWTLSSHHSYDHSTQTLHFGDGTKRRATSERLGLIVDTILGPQVTYYLPDGRVGGRPELVPTTVAVAPDGQIYVSTRRQVLRRDHAGKLHLVAGTGGTSTSCDHSTSAFEVGFAQISGLALGPDGRVYIADFTTGCIFRTSSDGGIALIAGLGSSLEDGIPASEADFSGTSSLDVGPDGSLYVSDARLNCVRRIDPEGAIHHVAGICGYDTYGYSGDGGLATEAKLNWPENILAAPDGSVFISDYSNHRVRRVAQDGTITTYAGNGLRPGPDGARGDGGLAVAARIAGPGGLALSEEGTLYIAEFDGSVVRAVGSDGYIVTVTGTGSSGFAGDQGPARRAIIASAGPLALMPNGALLLGDFFNRRIRRIAPAFPAFQLGDVLLADMNTPQLYRFDTAGRHLSTVDARTTAIVRSFAYDAAGRLSSVTDADGNVIHVERDAIGVPTALIGPFGQKTLLSLDGNHYLAAVIDPASNTHTMEYSSDGLLLRFEDPRGNASTFEFDSVGRLARAGDAAEGSWTISRSGSGPRFIVRATTAEGRTTTSLVEHLASGEQRRRLTAPDGSITEELIDPEAGRHIEYAPDGTVLEQLTGPDPRFGMQAPLAETIRLATPTGLSSLITRTSTVQLADANNPFTLERQVDTWSINGKVAQRTFDASSNTYVSTTPLGRIVTTRVDAQSRPTSIQVAGLHPSHFTYDGRGRLHSVTVGVGDEARLTTMSYGSDGLLSAVIDPLQRILSFTRDASGRIVKQTLPDRSSIEFTYDDTGNVTALFPPGREAHLFEYTPVNLEEQYSPPAIDPGLAITRYRYNKDKQLVGVLRPDGTSIEYAYSAGGRLATVVTPRGSYLYRYDPTSGLLNELQAPDGHVLRYRYDGFLLTEERSSGSISGSVQFSYDQDIRTSAITVLDHVVHLGYDDDGLLTQAGPLTLVRDADHGLVAATSLGALTTREDYNDFGELRLSEAFYGAKELYKVAYERDELGRITRMTEVLDGQVSSYVYGYDINGRLESVAKNGIEVSRYHYDDNGNRIAHNDIAATYDGHDRLLTYGPATYIHSENGERVSKTKGGATTRYVYDVLGNLERVSLPGDITVEYVIDGRNRRIGKKTNGMLVQGFLYEDQLKPVAQLDDSGALVSLFVYGDKGNVPAYMLRGGITYRILSDQLGSPRLVVNTSDGSISQRMDYDAFGNVLLDTNPGFQPFGFAGGLYDHDTKLTRFGARDYDAEHGRWTAKDPLAFDGGDTNLYAYALSDPLNLIDLDGLLAGCLHAFQRGITLSQAAEVGRMGTGAAIAGAAAVGLAGSELALGKGIRPAGRALGKAGTMGCNAARRHGKVGLLALSLCGADPSKREHQPTADMVNDLRHLNQIKNDSALAGRRAPVATQPK